MAEENNRFLRERRMAMHLTQQAVADRAGICLQQYQKLEYGERNLNNASFCLAARVLKALEINVSDYLRGDYTEVTKSPREELTGMDTGNVKYYLLHFEVEDAYLESVNKILEAANVTWEEVFKTAVEYFVKHPNELKEASERHKGEPEIVTNVRFIPVYKGETDEEAIEAAEKEIEQ